MRKFTQFMGTALATFVLVAGGAVVLLGVLVPMVSGATTYAVLADSMAPRYPAGTLMVVRPTDTIAIGDVITYQIEPDDPTVVTHRVVAMGTTVGGDLRLTTRGDANQISDPVQVRPEQVRGALWYAVPFAGYLVIALNGWREYAKLGVAALLVGYALFQVIRAIADKSRKSPKATDSTRCAAVATTIEQEPKPLPVIEPLPVLEPPPVIEPLPVLEPVERSETSAETTAPVEESTSFMPTMTRAERRRREAQFALIS